jgi:hypothetical protein
MPLPRELSNAYAKTVEMGYKQQLTASSWAGHVPVNG